MTKGLTDVDAITLKYFTNSQYVVDETEDTIEPDSIPRTVPSLYKERIVQLFNNLVHETPTAETTDKLESIFRAFVTESVSMYRTIDAMPQQRSLDTIDTQDIAIHELDKDLVKQIGTSGKRTMEEFAQYNSISKLPEPPRITAGDKISPYGSDGSDGCDGKKIRTKSGGKKIIKRKKKAGKDPTDAVCKSTDPSADTPADTPADKKRRRKRQDDKKDAIHA